MYQRSLLSFLITFVFLAGTCCAKDKKIYPELTTHSGRQFTEVTILKIEPDGITIMHKDGGCRLPVEDIPDNLQQELGISLDSKAITYREARLAKLRATQKKAQQAQELAARKRQRAMIARIVEQQEKELSQDAKVKVLEIHNEGYLCKVVYPITVDVTKQVTTTLGATKTIVVGKKTIYPKDFEAQPIYLLSSKRLSKGREFPLRILHEQAYTYTNNVGVLTSIEQYKVISP